MKLQKNLSRVGNKNEWKITFIHDTKFVRTAVTKLICTYICSKADTFIIFKFYFLSNIILVLILLSNILFQKLLAYYRVIHFDRFRQNNASNWVFMVSLQGNDWSTTLYKFSIEKESRMYKLCVGVLFGY